MRRAGWVPGWRHEGGYRRTGTAGDPPAALFAGPSLVLPSAAAGPPREPHRRPGPGLHRDPAAPVHGHSGGVGSERDRRLIEPALARLPAADHARYRSAGDPSGA